MSIKENTKKQDDQFEEKVLFVNRCSKVVKGGRKFSFAALILVGNGAGKVGIGFAKANELTDAIRKGGELARKDLQEFEVQDETIPHEVFVDYDGAQLLLKPAPKGTGVVAGSRTRTILEFAGYKNVVAKSMGSNNPLNQVKATFKALSQLKNRDKILATRGVA
jgi:small subunit ribosomal protein S5